MKKTKFITCIYTDLYGSELGGRPGRYNHYRWSLLSLLKMTDADFVCYTSETELKSLEEFFYRDNNVSQEQLKFVVYDIWNCKYKDLINSRKDVEFIKKGDRCIEIQYSKFAWWYNEDGSYENYYWIDAGLSHERNFWSQTVDAKWYTNYDRSIHIIGGMFGGKKEKWGEIVNLFETYMSNILGEDDALPHEELIMTLMYVNHNELFERKHFDIWWCPDNAPQGTPDELFQQNKSFYKILEELNKIYE